MKPPSAKLSISNMPASLTSHHWPTRGRLVRYFTSVLFGPWMVSAFAGTSCAVDSETASLHDTVDSQIAQSLEAKHILTAERCSDAEFLRRIHLDLTGS